MGDLPAFEVEKTEVRSLLEGPVEGIPSYPGVVDTADRDRGGVPLEYGRN